MPSTDAFADCVTSFDALPEPFGRASLSRHLTNPKLIVYGPSFNTLGQRRPATALAVSESSWLIASDDAAGRATVAAKSFDETLLVQLASVLLSGHLRIDYGKTGSEAGTAAIDFNTVMIELYRRAIDMVLAGIEGAERSRKSGSSLRMEIMADWPMKLRNAAVEQLAHAGAVRAATCWGEVVGGFHRQIAPAAALITTEREVILISDEPALPWERAGSHAHYGTIVTFFPRVRLANFDLSRSGPAGVLELAVHASHGGEHLHVSFPADQMQTVRSVLEWTKDPVNN